MLSLHPSVRILLALLLFGVAGARAVAAGEDSRVDGVASWWIAASLAEEGDSDGALENYEKAIELDPDEPFLRVDFAEFLYRQRLVSRAQKQVDRALELAPDEPVVLRAYGQVQLAQAGRSDAALQRAIRTFEKLREVDPDDIEGMLILGQLYQGADDVDRAIEIYEELVRNNTDNQQLKRLLVDTLTKAGRDERAREVLEEILRLEQESIESRLRLAELESEKGNHSAAIDILSGRQRSGAQDPRLIEALAREHFLRAQSPGIGGQKRGEDLERALELLQNNEPDAETVGSMGFLEANVLGSMGRVSEAIEVLRGLGEAARRDLRIPLFLSRLLESEGEVDEAAAILEELDGAVSGRPGLVAEVRDRLARLEARRGRWLRVRDLTEGQLQAEDEAVRLRALSLHLDALVELDDASAALLALRREQRRYAEVPDSLVLREAQIMMRSGRKRDAIRVLERPQLAASDDSATVLSLARMYVELERAAKAQEIVEKFASEGSFERLLLAGQFHLSIEAFEDASPYFARALETDDALENEDWRADAHFQLGQSLERSGEVAAAAEQFRAVLEIREDDSTALNYLGYMLADAGQDLEEALSLIERAVEMEPRNGAYADSLGWAHFRMGQLEEARLHLERAAELTPQNATIHEHLGDVYQEMGLVDLARAAYTKAVELEDEGLDEAEGDPHRKLEALGKPQR